MTFAIETAGLTRQYGRLEVVQSLDLRVPAGSIFAPVGPNGAGKTTTIKMLMNLVRPTRGSATIAGIDSRQLTPGDFERIGYVSERYSYYLRNTRMREAVPGNAQPLAAAMNALRFLSMSVSHTQDDLYGFSAREVLVGFSVPSGPGGQSIVLDDAWLAGAEPLIVSTARAGTVERDLTIAGFPLTLPTRTASFE